MQRRLVSRRKDVAQNQRPNRLTGDDSFETTEIVIADLWFGRKKQKCLWTC